jgi:hypothetical protein
LNAIILLSALQGLARKLWPQVPIVIGGGSLTLLLEKPHALKLVGRDNSAGAEA